MKDQLAIITGLFKTGFARLASVEAFCSLDEREVITASRRIDRVLGYNEHHYPGGTEDGKGGQFAPKEDGGGGGGGDTATLEAPAAPAGPDLGDGNAPTPTGYTDKQLIAKFEKAGYQNFSGYDEEFKNGWLTPDGTLVTTNDAHGVQQNHIDTANEINQDAETIEDQGWQRLWFYGGEIDFYCHTTVPTKKQVQLLRQSARAEQFQDLIVRWNLQERNARAEEPVTPAVVTRVLREVFGDPIEKALASADALERGESIRKIIGYRPDQERDPGGEGGGQWVHEGGGADDGDTATAADLGDHMADTPTGYTDKQLVARFADKGYATYDTYTPEFRAGFIVPDGTLVDRNLGKYYGTHEEAAQSIGTNVAALEDQGWERLWFSDNDMSVYVRYELPTKGQVRELRNCARERNRLEMETNAFFVDVGFNGKFVEARETITPSVVNRVLREAFGEDIEKVMGLAAAFEIGERIRKIVAFDPDQPRDDHGRWTDTGGGGGDDLKRTSVPGTGGDTSTSAPPPGDSESPYIRLSDEEFETAARTHFQEKGGRIAIKPEHHFRVATLLRDDVMNELDRLATDVPLDQTVYVRTADFFQPFGMRSAAATDTENRTIMFDSRTFSDYGRLRGYVEEGIAHGWHDAMTDTANIVTHEYGHIFDDATAAAPNDSAVGRARAEFQRMSREIVTRRGAAELVTGYAAQDPLENFAESFSAMKWAKGKAAKHPTVYAMQELVNAYKREHR